MNSHDVIRRSRRGQMIYFKLINGNEMNEFLWIQFTNVIVRNFETILISQFNQFISTHLHERALEKVITK